MPFSLQLARNLGTLARLAYAEPGRVKAALGGLLESPVKFTSISNQDTDTQAFVVDTPSCVHVVFRGTESMRDWLTDVMVWRSPWGGEFVHHGFAESLDSVLPEIDSAVAAAGKKPVVVTGHSLGAALATLYAYSVANRGGYVPMVYTFGSPRVGNSRFAAAYNSLLRDETYRVVNDADIVPRLPGPIAGYRHVGHEVFIDVLLRVWVDLDWWQKIPSVIAGNLLVWRVKRGIAPLIDHDMDHYLQRLGLTQHVD
jgi:triacylglycerol lipase